MKSRKTGAVTIFIGALLTVVFVVGLICSKNPGALLSPRRYDYTLEAFCTFCRNWYIPAGIVGIPMFLISLLLDLRRDAKDKSGS